jgi:1-acyl-sn-glycerol-3-phosphate acyltransferase
MSEVEERVARLELPWSAGGLDPYGIDRKHLVRWFTLGALFYRHYFRVRVHGAEHVPARGAGMLIGNHSGGVAIDAFMVLIALLLEKDPPRLAQGMVEKFLGKQPFAALWSARTGQFPGTPENCERLLRDGRLLMVFPEGARGTAKLYWQADSLVEFGTGFMRLAMRTGAPILPLGVVGAGAVLPTVMNLYALGRLVGAPYLPVTPYLLPVPLPAPLSIHYGAPMYFRGTGDEDDDVIAANVDQVKARIAELIAQGRSQRR